MIKVTVKGTIDQTLKALTEKGIDSVGNIHQRASLLSTGSVFTTAEIEDRFSDVVVKWYGESGEAPFPEGTLLHFSVPNKSESGGTQ